MAKQGLEFSKLATSDKEPRIGIPEKNREGVIKILTMLLCDEYVLATKTKKYHWNVVGPDFSELHEFFEEQYKELDGAVDEIAERIRALGGQTVGTLVEFAENTRLKEDPGMYPDAQAMIANLLDSHESAIRTLREDVDAADEKYHDMGTNDFLIDMMRRHEKMAWMLRAYTAEGSQ
jgi:starvation-inducible DNA-binding protein